jgi:hypothetical protein
MLQRWVGTHTPVLEYQHLSAFGWNGTWLGAVALSLQDQNLTIVGGAGLPLVRKNDMCLVDMASAEDRQKMALGCWTHSVWRLSDLYTLTGNRVSDLMSAHWMQPVGWRDTVLDTINS